MTISTLGTIDPSNVTYRDGRIRSFMKSQNLLNGEGMGLLKIIGSITVEIFLLDSIMVKEN